MTSGSCQTCPATGKCLKTTTKYGACVCTKCDCGYSGEQCQTPPPPVYEVQCGNMEAGRACIDMQEPAVDATAEWLERPAQGDTCLTRCAAKGTELGTGGCCYFFKLRQTACRFFPGIGNETVSQSYKST